MAPIGVTEGTLILVLTRPNFDIVGTGICRRTVARGCTTYCFSVFIGLPEIVGNEIVFIELAAIGVGDGNSRAPPWLDQR